MKRKMKLKDYFYLAKQSLKSRKKSSRNTVRGIAFGLVLILPVLFFSLAYYMDFNKKINEKESVYCLNMKTLNIDNEAKDTFRDYYSLLNFDIISELENADIVKQKIVSEKILLQKSFSSNEESGIFIKTSSTDFKKIDLTQSYAFGKPTNKVFDSVRILDYDLSFGKIFPSGAEADIRDIYDMDSLFSGGGNFSAETKGNREIILSEYFVEWLGLSPKTAVGKTFTMKTLASPSVHGPTVDDDTDPGNEIVFQENYEKKEFLLCENFVIVGVLRKEYYALINSEQESHLIISDASVYSNESRDSFKPMISLTTIQGPSDSYDTVLYTYPTTDIISHSQAAIQAGKFFPAYGYNIEPSKAFNNYAQDSDMVATIQFKSYKDANIGEKIILSRLNKLKTANDDNYVPGLNFNILYSGLAETNKYSMALILILTIFGGIILLATLLNLYNTIEYSVESRRNYMGMLRAIGTKNYNIKGLYFVEIGIIFVKVLLRVIIFGGLLCVGVKIGFEGLYKHLEPVFGLSLTLNFVYFPIVLGATVIVSAIVSALYAVICCHPLCNKPILSVLKDGM